MDQSRGAFDFTHTKVSAPDKSKPKSPRSPRGSPNRNGKSSKKNRQEALVTYLNVHAGVSIGVLAGMDVGAHDRFEVGCRFLIVLL